MTHQATLDALAGEAAQRIEHWSKEMLRSRNGTFHAIAKQRIESDMRLIAALTAAIMALEVQ